MKKSLILVLIGCLTACSPSLKTKDLSFAKGVRVDLPPVGAFEHPIGATHQLEVQNLGQVYRFPAQVEIEKDSVVIVGLTPVGSRAFSLVYDGSTMTYDAIPFFNLPLEPDDFLLAYILAVWPKDVLAENLQHQGLRLAKAEKYWHIYRDEQPLVRYFERELESGKTQLTLQHLQKGYWLKVKTLQWEIFED